MCSRSDKWGPGRGGITSDISPFLFVVVMDRWAGEVRQGSMWITVFADDTVICEECRKQVEESPERWRCAAEKKTMKLSRERAESVGMRGGRWSRTRRRRSNAAQL